MTSKPEFKSKRDGSVVTEDVRRRQASELDRALAGSAREAGVLVFGDFNHGGQDGQ